MSPFEWLAAAYFVTLSLCAPLAPVRWRRRVAVMALSAVIAGAVAAMAWHGSVTLRAWAPHAYLTAGYWVPGLLAGPVVTATGFEMWLQKLDERIRPRLPEVPLPLTHVAELAYLLCYPLVPASFLVAWIAGGPADVARFWIAVLVAGYACYVGLPWLVSRPPRLVAQTAPARYLGAINGFVLGRVSHQLNTFPSGHVAVALAAAGALWPVSGAASAVVACAAVAVAVGAAAGRYHYVTDVWTGAVVAAIAVAIARAAG